MLNAMKSWTAIATCAALATTGCASGASMRVAPIQPAPGATAFPSDRDRGDHHPTREPLDPLDLHPFELRKQHFQRLTFTPGT